MTYLFLPFVVIIFVIVLLRWSGHGRFQLASTQGVVYRASGRILNVMRLVCVVSAALGIVGFIQATHTGFFLLSLGLFFSFLSAFGVRRLRKAKVVLSDNYLTYFSGRGSDVEKVQISSIKSVVVANGLITIDLGTIPRLVIPSFFSNSQQLVVVLREKSMGSVAPSDTKK